MEMRDQQEIQNSDVIPNALGEGIPVPTHWVVNEDSPTLFANHMFASFQDGQFIVTFGQGHRPYVLSPDDETIKIMQSEGIQISPVVRLAISPEVMHKFLKVLNGLFERVIEPIDVDDEEAIGS